MFGRAVLVTLHYTFITYYMNPLLLGRMLFSESWAMLLTYLARWDPTANWLFFFRKVVSTYSLFFFQQCQRDYFLTPSSSLCIYYFIVICVICWRSMYLYFIENGDGGSWVCLAVCPNILLNFKEMHGTKNLNILHKNL